MLFFQCLLVGGYAYAHALSRLSPRKQVIVHLALLLLALPFLPVIPGNEWKLDMTGDPTLRIVFLLACTVGPPYFVLSTASPLLQSWFTRSYHDASPYRLYALSNAGALLALATYPVIVEPTLFLRTQAIAWSGAYVLFALMFAYCALRVWNTANPACVSRNPSESTRKYPAGVAAGPPQPQTVVVPSLGSGLSRRSPALRDEDGCHPDLLPMTVAEARPDPITAGERTPTASPDRAEKPGLLICALWAALPACGSVILLAVTNQMCCDVSVVPFLWVLPLALYLLSFILCFHSERWYFRPLFWPLLLAAMAGMIGLIAAGVHAPIWAQVTGFSGGAFVCFMVCHGETALLKPNPKHLTLYYLMLAAGGAAGGIFVGVAAPRMFTDYSELYVGLWACCMLSLLALRTVHAPYSSMKHRTAARLTAAAETLTVVILGCTLYDFALGQPGGRVRAYRNFYGTLTVMAHNTVNPARAYHVLQHGRIKHGAQFVSEELRRKPISYYGEKSGVGLAIRSFPTNAPLRVGIVGLGTGTIAAYGRPGDYYCFYEINPMAIRLATEFFTYIRDCPAEGNIVAGDARVSMERESSRQFDLIAVDAFTSDAIPVHLLTREAILLYLSHLKTRGILAIHISNRYLDLEPAVRAIADNLFMQTAVIKHTTSAAEKADQLDSSTWVLLARTRDILDAGPIVSAATPPGKTPCRTGPVWTDDYNDLFMALARRVVPAK